ncbi:MAG: hypothetical protein GY906_09380 [bacterium]|nr:hypothetical protein [bacterium]
MERLAFELVDSGIVSVSDRGQVSPASPGLAVVDGDHLQVGLDAARNARLKPRRLHSQFWQNLGTAELGRPYPRHLRTADLAHAHLSQLWEASGRLANEVIVAVPGVYSAKQLGLFLGVAEACAMPVRGLVDLAVAATSNRETRRHCLHLDFHLHRVVVTEIEHGEDIVRRGVYEDSRVGLVDLYDLWARTIAQHFVRTTRFDPLHQATTEQILYTQLHKHLAALTDRESVEIAISSGDRRHTIELERRELEEAAKRPYDDVCNLVHRQSIAHETTLLLSDRAAALPGLQALISGHKDIEVIALHPMAVGSAALDGAGIICSTGPQLRLVTRLPGYDATRPAPKTIAVHAVRSDSAVADAPTHLVIDGVAHRLSSQPLMVPVSDSADNGGSSDLMRERQPQVRIDRGRAVVDANSLTSIYVNDEPIDGPTELVTGDRLRVGSTEAILVSMAD